MATGGSTQVARKVTIKFSSKSMCSDSGTDSCVTNDSESNMMVKLPAPGGCNKRKPMSMLVSQKLKRRKMDRGVKMKCGQILKELSTHHFGWAFSQPVDPVALMIPNYFDIISDPMDLGTIKSKLENNEYSSANEFASDVNLTFANAMRYNPPGNEFNSMAKVLDSMFKRRWKLMVDKWKRESVDVDQGIVQNESCEYDNEKIKPSPNAAVEVKKSMTREEKQKLWKQLMNMRGGKMPEKLHSILKTSNVIGFQEGKINFDVSACDDSTWLELSKLLKRPVNAISAKVIPEKAAQTGRCILPGKVACKGSSGSVDSKPPMSSNSSKCCSCWGMRCHCGHQTKSALSSSKEKSAEGQCAGARFEVVKKVLPTRATTSAQDSDCFGSGKDEERISTSPDISPPSASATSGEGWTKLDDECSLEKAQRVAMLRSRFAETILKASGKSDPKRMQEEKERLQRLNQQEAAKIKARIEEQQLKQKMLRDKERQAARSARATLERTVEVDDNLKRLKQLEMLCGWSSSSQHLYADGYRRCLRLIGLVLKEDFLEDEDEETFLYGDREEGEILA